MNTFLVSGESMDSKRTIFVFFLLYLNSVHKVLISRFFSNLTRQNFRNTYFLTKEFTLSSNTIFFEIEIDENINLYIYIEEIYP